MCLEYISSDNWSFAIYSDKNNLNKGDSLILFLQIIFSVNAYSYLLLCDLTLTIKYFVLYCYFNLKKYLLEKKKANC